MNMSRCRLSIFAICVAFFCLWLPVQLDAKAWLNGHITEMTPGGLVLRTRFYPHITVHISDQTIVRCKKQFLKTSDLEVDDLVTVEGRDKNGLIEATKITIHRDWLKCREIKGPKPQHCKC